jgi:hypothetical protein
MARDEKSCRIALLAAVIIAWWLRREDELRPLPNVDWAGWE